MLSRADVEDVLHFVEKDGELEKLKRALNLYGQSLRKGEIPDEISRKAEFLTEKFVQQAMSLKSVKSDGDIKKISPEIMKALNEYLDFAKLSRVESADY